MVWFWFSSQKRSASFSFSHLQVPSIPYRGIDMIQVLAGDKLKKKNPSHVHQQNDPGDCVADSPSSPSKYSGTL